MKGETDESVGAEFSEDLLQAARDKTLEVILEAAKLARAGYSEAETKADVASIQTRLGAPKSWHPPQIRFGENTLLAFGTRGIENARLNANDIFFIDIGPIFDGHEGDVGRAFAVGDDPEMHKCCRDIEKIWHDVRDHWRATQATGAELYKFAEDRAGALGWVLLRDHANGHRIADFPHAARGRGSVEGWQDTPATNRWILEIQIRHPTRPFGAFYEDLLN